MNRTATAATAADELRRVAAVAQQRQAEAEAGAEAAAAAVAEAEAVAVTTAAGRTLERLVVAELDAGKRFDDFAPPARLGVIDLLEQNTHIPKGVDGSLEDAGVDTDTRLVTQLVKVGPLHGLLSLEAWKDLDVGLAHPVNILICGERHSNTANAYAFRRYVFGQVALGKCVDLYLEDGFDWVGVKHVGAGGLGKLRSLAIGHLPGLRVHRTDIRFVYSRGDDPTIVRRLEMAHNPFIAHRGPVVSSNLLKIFHKKGLFDFKQTEILLFMTGFDSFRSGGRSLEELDEQYSKDSAKLSRYMHRKYIPRKKTQLRKDNPQWTDEDIEEESMYILAMYLVDPPLKFKVRRERTQKQFRRYVESRPGLDNKAFEQELTDLVRKRLSENNSRARESEKRLHAATIAMDVFTFLRMFGTFRERSSGIGKDGCPLEQQNIAYYCGDHHARNLKYLIRKCFEPKSGPKVSVQMPADIRTVANEAVARVKPFTLF